jgi:hypothetical protein
MHALHICCCFFGVFCREKGTLWREKASVMWWLCALVAFTRYFGLVLMQTPMQTLRILCRYCADFCTKNDHWELWSHRRELICLKITSINPLHLAQIWPCSSHFAYTLSCGMSSPAYGKKSCNTWVGLDYTTFVVQKCFRLSIIT